MNRAYRGINSPSTARSCSPERVQSLGLYVGNLWLAWFQNQNQPTERKPQKLETWNLIIRDSCLFTQFLSFPSVFFKIQIRFWANRCRSLFSLWLRTRCVCSWKGVDWRRRYQTLDQKAWCLSSTLPPAHPAFLLNICAVNGIHPADGAPCAVERCGRNGGQTENEQVEKSLQIISSSQCYFKTRRTRKGTVLPGGWCPRAAPGPCRSPDFKDVVHPLGISNPCISTAILPRSPAGAWGVWECCLLLFYSHFASDHITVRCHRCWTTD